MEDAEMVNYNLKEVQHSLTALIAIHTMESNTCKALRDKPAVMFPRVKLPPLAPGRVQLVGKAPKPTTPHDIAELECAGVPALRPRPPPPRSSANPPRMRRPYTGVRRVGLQAEARRIHLDSLPYGTLKHTTEKR